MSQSQTDRATNAQGGSYIHGYSDEFQRLHGQRTAAVEAGFFLPYLRAGMDLVDCGCGPGSITVDLATIVAPGQVVGIDVAQRQLDYARALAAQRGVANARFESGDVYAIPFPDASFDAAFAHNLLQHVKDPLRALRDMRRVLKPGGVVAIQDDDWGAYFWEPATPLLRTGIELFLKVAEANGASFFYAPPETLAAGGRIRPGGRLCHGTQLRHTGADGIVRRGRGTPIPGPGLRHHGPGA